MAHPSDGRLVATILLPLAFSHGYEDLISALSWLAIAALARFYFGARPLAAISRLIGLLSLFAALAHRIAMPS